MYSNHGMALAGYVVETVSGEDFAGYAQRHIFTPLGMTSSTFSQPPPPAIATRAAMGEPGPFLNPYPAGSLITTPMDMGRFIASQLGSPLDGAPRILPDTARHTMLAQHFTPHPAMPGAAYGYFESVANGHRSLHHTGDGGDHSLIYLVPEAKLGFYVVYTAPQRQDPATPRERIAQDVIEHYLGCAAPFKQPGTPTGFAAQANHYAGTYRLDTYSHRTAEKVAALTQEITITNHGDGSLSADLGGGPIRLIEAQPDLFRDPDGAYVAFHRDPVGDITALSFTAAAVDDPGGAHRLRWWETAISTLVFLLLVVLLILGRAGGGLVVRWRGRHQKQGRQPPTLAWRLSGWIIIALLIAVALVAGSVVTAGGVITGVPLGVTLALLLINLAAALGVILGVITANELIHRRGGPLQRILLGSIASAAIMSVPFLGYWNLLGLRY